MGSKVTQGDRDKPNLMNTSVKNPAPRSSRRIHAAAALLCCAFSWTAHAVEFTQTVNSGGGATATNFEWNDAIWGSPAATPNSGDTYVSASGLMAVDNTVRLGTAGITGRVRAYNRTGGTPTFGGGSLRLVSGTELLVKDTGTYTANIILDGGILRFSPDAGAHAIFAGTIHAQASSVIGSVQSNASSFTFDSVFTGSADLRLAGGTSANQSLIFSDTSDFSAYSGTLNIGGGVTNAGGANLVTVSFGLGSHDLRNATLAMGAFATADILNLAGNVSVGSFAFGSGESLNILGAGTYTVAQLNAFGNGSQFTGTGTLQVIPEPSAFAALAGLAGLAVVGLKRRRQS